MITQLQIKDLFEYKNNSLYWKNVKVNRYVKNGALAGSNHHSGYRNIKINGKLYSEHRLIFLYHYGYIPKEIDHIDGNSLNNDINNLRMVTKSQNAMNRKSRKNSSSIYKGVCWDKIRNKWVVHITINKKLKYLGRFINEKEAALVYNEAAIKYHGEYAKLNEV